VEILFLGLPPERCQRLRQAEKRLKQQPGAIPRCGGARATPKKIKFFVMCIMG
jgi:hypothetical protein